MTIPLTSAHVERLRRVAKRLAANESIPLHAALHRLANEHGYATWPLLVKHSRPLARAVQVASTPSPAISITPQPQAIEVGSPNIHYLHGDQHEVYRALFYCQSCDKFVAREHFFERHERQETLQLVISALNRWRSASNEVAYMRPDGVYNVLEEDARQAAIDFQNSRGEFHRWLERHKGKITPVGDLATDVLRDKQFPVAVKTADDAVGYLQSRFAAEAVLRVMKQAWRQFEAAQKRKARPS